MKNIISEASSFAVHAHEGQVRKIEKDKPMVIHPFNVAKVLKEYGCDDNLVASGYLHDVVEDTSYTIEDIYYLFGEDIADLVYTASESDKNLSWEERKQETIVKTRDLPLRNKLLICADKISNLEDLAIKFEKTGDKNFSAFKRGEDSQHWYYENVYQSLIHNEDKNNPMFVRLKHDIDRVFNNSKDNYIKQTIFDGKESQYNKLLSLNASKEELIKLRDLCVNNNPYIIEFSGTPRTGKTSTIKNLSDFFKKGGFDVSVVNEFTSSEYFKNNIRPLKNKMSYEEYLYTIMKSVIKQLEDLKNTSSDIILIDRSVNDRLIWNHIGYMSYKVSDSCYREMKTLGNKVSNELIDSLIVTYTDALTALRRDYMNSLALEKRRFLNTENIAEYNIALNALLRDFESQECFNLIDTTNVSTNETAFIAGDSITKNMRKKYLDRFKTENSIK